MTVASSAQIHEEVDRSFGFIVLRDAQVRILDGAMRGAPNLPEAGANQLLLTMGYLGQLRARRRHAGGGEQEDQNGVNQERSVLDEKDLHSLEARGWAA
jgi:hypothetical protein